MSEIPRMDICHAHNLNRDLTEPKPFGIRVSLRADDPFARLIGFRWERMHWFATETERNRALADMAGEHVYSRTGDRPNLRYEAVDLEQN